MKRAATSSAKPRAAGSKPRAASALRPVAEAVRNVVRFEYRRPALYPKQFKALFTRRRYALIEASTKSGKSVGAMAWIFEEALRGKPGWQYWWVAPTVKQAKIIFRRCRRGLRMLKGPPDFALYSANNTELTLTLFNGTTICFMSGEIPDNLYGEDVHAAVIDEASRTREDSWHAIRTTLTATQGPVRIIGNVKGRKNWFYNMARRAEAAADDPNSNMHWARITADDAVAAGVLAAEEIEDARANLPEMIFRELFYAEPGEDEGNPFGMKAIAACIGPLSTKAPKVWGWDLAKSVDWTVGIALDEDRQVCRFVRFQKPWKETIAEIRRHTRHCLAYVDSTGVGDPIVEELQRRGGQNFRPFLFNMRSKQQIMEGLAVAIQGGSIRYPDGPIASELKTFEYEYRHAGIRYVAAQGCHDDCVVALALANHGLILKPRTDFDDAETIVIGSEITPEVDRGPYLSDDEY